MKIVQVNATSGVGSTGKICAAVSDILSSRGIENYILYSIGNSSVPNSIKFSNTFIRLFQSLLEKLSGRNGFVAKFSTAFLIKRLNEISPDIVHLHNIHSHDIDLKMLFGYLKRKKIRLFWTFHDCWAFTGGCTHYDMIGCEKWKSQCINCQSYRNFSYFFDVTDKNFTDKIKVYAKELDLTIVTPSNWLGEQVKQSFLKSYSIKVINNGIDLDLFKPRKSDFRKKYDCENKFILLGVSFVWSVKKGIDIFIKLAQTLDSRYQIVLVGTNETVDKQLPSNVISIHRTNNQVELAEIYSAADLFVQVTREENFPTVNIESLACGTPILTFRTGGSPEIIDDTCGMVVEKNDFNGLKEAIEYIYTQRPYSEDSCMNRAQLYNKDNRFIDYSNLYNE